MMKKIWTAIKKGWMKFAHILGRINTTILLTILYFVIIGIYSIIAQIIKLITLPFKKEPKTYWITRDEKFDPDSFKHSF